MEGGGYIHVEGDGRVVRHFGGEVDAVCMADYGVRGSDQVQV